MKAYYDVFLVIMSLGKDSDPVIGFKKFVSEEELEEARKKRQEEWEKVRKPDDPEGMQMVLAYKTNHKRNTSMLLVLMLYL